MEEFIGPGPCPIKKIPALIYATLKFKYSDWLKKSGDHFQPIKMLKFQHSVNLRWNFLYRTGSWFSFIEFAV